MNIKKIILVLTLCVVMTGAAGNGRHDTEQGSIEKGQMIIIQGENIGHNMEKLIGLTEGKKEEALRQSTVYLYGEFRDDGSFYAEKVIVVRRA